MATQMQIGRRARAAERLAYSNGLTLEERLARIDGRPGTSSKEVLKLQRLIRERDAPQPVKVQVKTGNKVPKVERQATEPQYRKGAN